MADVHWHMPPTSFLERLHFAVFSVPSAGPCSAVHTLLDVLVISGLAFILRKPADLAPTFQRALLVATGFDSNPFRAHCGGLVHAGAGTMTRLRISWE